MRLKATNFTNAASSSASLLGKPLRATKPLCRVRLRRSSATTEPFWTGSIPASGGTVIIVGGSETPLPGVFAGATDGLPGAFVTPALCGGLPVGEGFAALSLPVGRLLLRSCLAASYNLAAGSGVALPLVAAAAVLGGAGLFAKSRPTSSAGSAFCGPMQLR